MATSPDSYYTLTQFKLLILLLLTLVGMATTDDIECFRWNCPCTGLTSRRPSVTKRWSSTYLADSEAARKHTQQIVNRMITSRFRDEDHIALLRDCSNTRSVECTHAHMEYNCTLEGLPSLSLIKQLERHDITADKGGFLQFVRQTRSLLAKLAVFVDQARHDEERHVTRRRYSMANAIRILEEQHLYHMLCNLDVDFVGNKLSRPPDVSRQLMQVGCRRLGGQAAIDNRNYIVFYTLEQLLKSIAIQFRKVHKKRQLGPIWQLAKSSIFQIRNG